MGGHANVTLCGRNAKDKKIQNISEIEQKSPVLTRTLSSVLIALQYRLIAWAERLQDKEDPGFFPQPEG